MKKVFTLIFGVLVCAATAFAAPHPGKVVKIGPNTITLHWDANTRNALDSRTGSARKGLTTEHTYTLTPQTTYWQGGKQIALSNIQKGEMATVTSAHGVASRIDIQ
jgi:hypothetical protein